MATEPVTVFAPAKVNLTLHVTGRRADGYHLLDSLVVFAGVGDAVTARPVPGMTAGGPAGGTERLTLAVTGPQAAGVPAGDDNLVLRAARRLQAEAFGASGASGGAPGTPGTPGAALVLEKRLPPASGLGGGSADAAAALRALAALWRLPVPAPEFGLPLGADVPVCLASRPARMGGIGAALGDCPALPPLWMVLANPRIETPTAAVFAALERRDNPPMPEVLPQWRDAAALAAWAGGLRNDLEAPARALVPAIGDVLAALSRLRGALMARMSGSGATCFALFASAEAAAEGAAALRRAAPGWWVADAPLLGAVPEAA